MQIRTISGLELTNLLETRAALVFCHQLYASITVLGCLLLLFSNCLTGKREFDPETRGLGILEKEIAKTTGLNLNAAGSLKCCIAACHICLYRSRLHLKLSR
jgi:hypothetical protein